MPGSDDVAVDVVRSLVRTINEPALATEMRGPVDDWESLAIVLELGDGHRRASGYAYPADGTVTPGACGWNSIEPALHAYLDSHDEAGYLLPVKILVQFERATARYEVTFENADDERWKTRPGSFREMREQLRPSSD